MDAYRITLTPYEIRVIVGQLSGEPLDVTDAETAEALAEYLDGLIAPTEAVHHDA